MGADLYRVPLPKEVFMKQIVVIKADGEVLLVLNVSNYNRNFETVVKEARESYNETNGDDLLENYIVKAMQNSDYRYEYVGFTSITV